MDPLLYSVADAAPLLAVKESTLRDLIAAGRIATVQHRPGGDRFIRRCDLEAYVASMEPRRAGRLALVTNRVTNRRQLERAQAGHNRVPTVKSVRYDPDDEEFEAPGS